MQNSKSLLQQIKSILQYTLIITLLVFISSWQILNLHFWKDEWSRLWMAHYKPYLLLNLLGLPNHPGLAIEEMLLEPIFGLNPFYWQLFGLLLKILASLSVGLIVLVTSHSQKVARVAGMFFAVSVIGIESFTGVIAHSSALIIIFFGVGFYYWVLSSQRNNILIFIASLSFLIISFLISPARAAALPLLLLIWDILTITRDFKAKTFLKLYVVKWFIFLLFIFLIFSLFHGENSSLGSELVKKTNIISSHFSSLNNFFASIGNLNLAWIIPIPETAGLSTPTFLNLTASFLFFIFSGIVLFKFLRRRTLELQNQLFFFLFIPLTYLPNWWFYNYITLGASYRYLTIASIGIAFLVAIFITSFNKKYYLFLLLLVLGLNILYTNMLISSQLPYRSVVSVNKVWEQIDNIVPQGETDVIFVFTGKDPNRLMLLDWSSIYPFAIRRNINNLINAPIVLYQEETIRKMLCGEKVNLDNGIEGYTHNNKTPLSHLYAFRLDQGNIIDESAGLRNIFQSQINCSLEK